MSSGFLGGDTVGSKGHIFLPAWWVKAFECSTQSSLGRGNHSNKSPWNHSQESGIIPSLNVHELRGMAVALTLIQKFILSHPIIASKKQKKIVLNPADHFNNAGFLSQSRLFSFERLLQMLPAILVKNLPSPGAGASNSCSHPWLRIAENFNWHHDVSTLDEKSSSAPSSGDSLWEKYLAFKKTQDRIQNGEEVRRSLQLELDLGVLGVELCFGVTDGFVDLVRPEFSDHLGCLDYRPFKNAPIAAWHSLWLELTPYEMMLYLKLEKAMQWEFRWIGLDGVFGVKIQDFLEIGFDPKSIENEMSGGQDRLRAIDRSLYVLKRFGKKLEYHGYLTQLGEMQHRLIDMSGVPLDTAPMLLWQASAKRILGDRISDYKHQLRHIVMSPLTDCLKNHWISFLASDEEGALQFGSTLWEELIRVGPSIVADLESTQHFEFDETRLWSPIALFYEWVMRSQPKSPWPTIPEVIATSPLAPLFQMRDGTLGSWARRFEEFCLLLQDMPEISRIVRDEPMASLGSPVSARLSDLKDIYAQQRKLRWHGHDIGSVSLRDIQVSNQLSEGSGVEESSLAAQSALPERERRSHAKGLSMLRTAENELAALESKDQSQYQELRRAYLGSLDEIGQKLIHDVQARMQPHLFEEHLRKRIIRFMVENPGVWSISKDKSYAKKMR